MIRSAKTSLFMRRTSWQCHSCLPNASAALAATSALKTTQRAYLNITAQGKSAVTESPAHRSFNVTSEGQIQPSASTRPNETDESLIGKTGGESSNSSMPKSINRGLGVSESVEGQVANTFRRLSPHVRARSIRDRDAWLARVNAQRKQWPFAD
ncbi:acetolactate synthase catalytic subunit [Trichoderma harzianum]|uniref:Acetolactate synthase catalytic subunit n=1 Tax=Trichoderma harzianum TaxID=5544 RepID=A0A0G0A0T2_TRIHA|nr:acetolactate synthase catalytic subunit [Trichoderma harzianum]